MKRPVVKSRVDKGPIVKSPVVKARSILLVILAVEVGVLVVTGIALYFLYVPTNYQAWGDITKIDDGGVRLAYGLRLVHRLVSRVAVPTAMATGVLVALRAGTGVRRWTGIALGVGLAVTTVAASFTGFLLPWDQLALWAVKVDSDIRGYGVLFGPSVRFVLAEGVELEKGTVVRWLVVHTLVLGPAVIALAALAWRRHRTSVPSDERTDERAGGPG